MLVACRLAGLSALGAHYAGVKWRAMRGRRRLLRWGVRAMADTLSSTPSRLRADHRRESGSAPGFRTCGTLAGLASPSNTRPKAASLWRSVPPMDARRRLVSSRNLEG